MIPGFNWSIMVTLNESENHTQAYTAERMSVLFSFVPISHPKRRIMHKATEVSTACHDPGKNSGPEKVKFISC